MLSLEEKNVFKKCLRYCHSEWYYLISLNCSICFNRKKKQAGVTRLYSNNI